MLGHNVIVVDYPQLGASKGELNQDGLTLSALLAYDWVAARAIGRISVVGRSLGAAVAAQLASQREVYHLVLISPWTNLKELALETTKIADKVPSSFWKDNSWDTENSKPVTKYMLVIHGVEDTLIPYRMGAEVAGAHNAGLFAVENAGHNDMFSDGSVFALLYQVLQM